MESARFAQLLRTRGLLSRAAGEHGAARADFEQALTVLRAARGETYVGVGELLLDLADLDLLANDAKSASVRLAAARPILDPVLAPAAPQRARLEALSAAART